MAYNPYSGDTGGNNNGNVTTTSWDGSDPVTGKTYSDDWWQSWFDSKLNGVSNTDISSYLDDMGVDPLDPAYASLSSSITDSRLQTDLTNAKVAAVKSGNTKLTNTLDLIFKYGDKAIAALVAAGVLDGPSLASVGYSNITQDTDGTIKVGSSKVAVQSAPLPSSAKIFGLDFTNPTVIIVTFALLMLLSYFLFFKKPVKR